MRTITRVGLASVAFVLCLAGASASFAQQADTTSSVPAARGFKPHRGAIGLQIGYSLMGAGGDYAEGARPRFSFSGTFRYAAGQHWGWQVSPYFTWAKYEVATPAPFRDPAFPAEPYKDHHLAQIAGASGQLLFLMPRGPFLYTLGAGPAVYRVVVQNHRRVIKDPVTFDRHQSTCLGATAQLGAEYYLKNLTKVSFAGTIGWHTAFAKDDESFPSGYSDSPQVFEVRIGAHYHFELGADKKPGAKPAGAR